MRTYLLIALRNLVQARRRTLLVGSALVMVTSLLVLSMALSGGFTDTMIRSTTALATGHVNIAGWYKSKRSDASTLLGDASALRKIVEENTPELDLVIDRQRGWGRLVSEVGAIQAVLSGIDSDEEQRFFESIRLAEEREYKEGGRAEVIGDLAGLEQVSSILLFASQAKQLGVGVGDTVTITIETWSGAHNVGDATVVAVAKDVGMMSNWNVYLPKAKLRELYQLKEDTTGAVMIYLDDVARSDEVMTRLRSVLETRGYTVMEHDPQAFWTKFERVSGEDWVGQRVDLTIWRDEVSYVTWMVAALDGISALLVSILLIIIVIGIMNSMWISVRERTSEVGTLRAIGMSRGGVLGMFMTEAAILGVVATTLGALLGAAIAATVDAARIGVPIEALRAILISDTIHLVVRTGQLGAAVALFTAVTVLSALLPALRAARLQPVTAIQTAT